MGVYGVKQGKGSPAQAGEPEARGKEGERGRTLRSLATSLLAVARELDEDETAEVLQEPYAGQSAQSCHRADQRLLLAHIVEEYSNRRQRRRVFAAELFGEPAWDLLLDLFRARLEGKMITVTSACIAADVPLSTALRWLGIIEQQGLIERSPNVSDQRSTWVRLTDAGVAAMIEYTEGCMTRARRADRLAEEGLLAMFKSRTQETH